MTASPESLETPTSEAYLGRGLLAGLGMLGLFALIAHLVLGDMTLNRFDRALGLWLAAHRASRPVVRELFLGITAAGSRQVLAAVGMAEAGILLWRRQRLPALVWTAAIVGGGLLDTLLKRAFGRERPDFRDETIVTLTKSFPSGHSMVSLIVYGMLAYFLVLLLPRRGARVAVVATLALLVLAIGFSRIYLGAHYCSDVLGGFAFGGAWLAACVTTLEVARRRKLTR
jgi:undecaprenyl-diphosphatase